MDFNVFKDLGFSERETKVYIALLELGSSKAGPISAKSGLPHTKVYETLDKLIEKGLVSYVIVSKTKFYEASEPKQILNIIEERKHNFLEVMKDLELKRKYTKDKQIAIIHEGFKAFKALFNRIADELTSNDFYFAFAFKQDYKDVSAPIFLRNFHSKLADKKVNDKAIAHYTVKDNVKRAFEGNKNIQVRFSKRNTPIGVIIIKDEVIQLMWGERPTAVEIKSSQIVQQYKEFFEEVWTKSKN